MPLQGVPSLFGGRRGVAAGGGTDIGNGWTLWSHTFAHTTNNNDVTTTGIDTTQADLLILVLASFDVVPAAVDVSDSLSNSWSRAVQTGTSGNARSAIFYSKPTTVGVAQTFTYSRASTFPTLLAMAVSGSHASPADQATGNQSTGATSLSTNALTPSLNSELIISGLSTAAAEGSTPAVDSGFTILDFSLFIGGTSIGGVDAYITQAGTGALNPTWSWTNSVSCADTIASFIHA